MIYGFRDFCLDFFGQYGDNFYIILNRFNGSVSETLFSQHTYCKVRIISESKFRESIRFSKIVERNISVWNVTKKPIWVVVF